MDASAVSGAGAPVVGDDATDDSARAKRRRQGVKQDASLAGANGHSNGSSEEPWLDGWNESSDETWHPGRSRSRSRSPHGHASDESGSDSDLAESPCFRPFLCVLGSDLATFESALQKSISYSKNALSLKDGLGRSLLHFILLRGRADKLASLISSCPAESLDDLVGTPFISVNTDGDDGRCDMWPSLHLALSTVPFDRTREDALRCLEQLLRLPCLDINCVDGLGRTALHVACLQGCEQAVSILLQHNANPSIQDDLGNFALHYAIDTRNRSCIEALLGASDSSRFTEDNHPFYRCIDRQAWMAALLIHFHKWPLSPEIVNKLFEFAAERGLTEEWHFVNEKGLELTGSPDELERLNADLRAIYPAPPTLLTYSSSCLGHGALLPEDKHPMERWEAMGRTPENPHRLEVICGDCGILRSPVFEELRWSVESGLAPLSDIMRVHEYSYICKLEKIAEDLRRKGDPSHKCTVDRSDTKMTLQSWEAARRACACVIEAVKRVCSGECRNAFCAIRPPGHHAGPAGACDSEDLDDVPDGSIGFCLLNNVAVGAAFARCVYRDVIEKVAIVDFDVHHGNGTEAIVRNIQVRKKKRLEVSGINCGGFTAQILATPKPTCMPWLDRDTDPENIFFASMHGYGDGFYPNTGQSCNEENPNIVNVTLRPGSGSAEFRDGLRSKIIPALLAFNPDMIFVSAGFDGHEGDILGVCVCVDEDYTWATQQLMAVANRCCFGRLVSVLEGGYNTRAESLSPFAQSVASHVRTLMNTSPSYTYLEGEVGAACLDADQQWCTRRAEMRTKREQATAPSSKRVCDKLMLDAFGSDNDADGVSGNDAAGGPDQHDSTNGVIHIA